MTRRERSPHRGFIGIVAMAICAIVLAYGIVVAAVRVVVGPDPCRDQIPPRDEELYEAPASPPGGGAVGLSLGPTTSCAAMRDGATYCWGDGIVERVTEIDAAESRTCVATEGGHVFCWGGVGACVRRCDDRSVIAVPTPQQVPVEDVVEVRLGRDHACVRKRDGSVACWGDNRRHQVSAFVPFDDYGYSVDRCDVTRRLDLPGSDYPVAVRW